MKTNSISNDRVLDTVYDLADVCGLRIDEFLARLQEEYGDPEFETDGLPEEVVAELQHAKTLRKEQRDARRKTEQDGVLHAEIAAFREQFPDVGTEDIPDLVWEDVADGADLKHAYAYYLISRQSGGNHAEEVNRDTSARSAAAMGDGSTEPAYTPEEVERMSNRDVAKHYKNIVRSMGNWKF